MKAILESQEDKKQDSDSEEKDDGEFKVCWSTKARVQKEMANKWKEVKTGH